MDSDRLFASVLLCWRPTLKVKPFFGSKTSDRPEPFVGQAQRRIVDQCIAEELRRLIVGGHVVIEIVRQVEPAGGHAKLVARRVPS